MYTDVSVPFLSPVFPFYQIEFHPRTWKEPKNSKWGRGDMFMMPLVYQIQFSAFCRSYFRRPCSLTISSLLNLLWHISADIGHWLYIYIYILKGKGTQETRPKTFPSPKSVGEIELKTHLCSICACSLSSKAATHVPHCSQPVTDDLGSCPGQNAIHPCHPFDAVSSYFFFFIVLLAENLFYLYVFIVATSNLMCIAFKLIFELLLGGFNAAFTIFLLPFYLLGPRTWLDIALVGQWAQSGSTLLN